MKRYVWVCLFILALPQVSAAATYYLSPNGNDSRTASEAQSEATPWKTFGKIFNSNRIVAPGDTIVLLDGEYTRTTTGLPSIDCNTNARNGTASAPITIKAKNERRAFLSSDGNAAGFFMTNCSYWNVEGLRARNADNQSAEQSEGFPFRFHKVNNIVAKRLLGSHNNRYHNTHVVAVENSENVLLEECEVYFFHRHGFSIWQSRYVTLRRCYANSMLYGRVGEFSTIDNRNWGDEAVSLYGTSDSIVENFISENQANGFQIHGIGNSLDPSGHGGRRNKVLGSVSLDDAIAMFVASRSYDLTSYHNARDNVVENFVAVRPGGNGVYSRAALNTVVRNVTLYRATGQWSNGVSADGGDPGLGGTCSATPVCSDSGAPCSSSSQCSNGKCVANREGCSIFGTNVLALKNKYYGFSVASQTDWRVEYSNAFGNEMGNYQLSEPIEDGAGRIQYSRSVQPTGMDFDTGGCVLWVPATSNMKGAGKNGADIGANILYRYVNGTLTNEPLWNKQTGAFPCGAVVAGVNDGERRCTNVHTRLNVNTSSCPFPAGYGGGGAAAPEAPRGLRLVP